MKTINPTTEELIATYALTSEVDIHQALTNSQHAFEEWSRKTILARAQCIEELANKLLQKKEHFAKLITMEMGKPIRQARAEVEKCASVCQHYASYAETYLKTKEIPTEATKSYVCYQPLGVILGIMPWNFPFWQVFRFAVPTLIAGNTVIIKHAPNTTGCGLAIAELFSQEFFPKFSYQNLILDEEQTNQLLTNDAIAGVSLTGSTRAGREIAQSAGRALKKVVLELGGNDPYIILNDADLENAVKSCISSRTLNAGQVCIAAKRIIIEKPIYEIFKEKLIQALEPYYYGNPLDENTLLGPLARKDIKTQVHHQVLASINSGAKLVTGGILPENQLGYFYPVTVLENVKPGMAAFDEEIFGPVFALICAESINDAIKLANQSNYGLTAAIFSQDLAKAEQIALEEIKVGGVSINGFMISDPRLPFGGIKHSGFGRELSEEGIIMFTNVKTIVIR